MACYISVGSPALLADEPTDSIPVSILDEFTISTVASRKMIGLDRDGSLSISAAMLNEIPTLLGGDDPLALLRTLPSVATNSELQAGIAVRGSSYGSNLFESDGMRIFNPMHLLGLFSAYNPAFYKDFYFRPSYIPATFKNLSGGYFGASAIAGHPDSVFSGKVSVGILESHGAVRIPVLKDKISATVAARKTYLDLFFPKILKMGSSDLIYGFTDLNAGIIIQPDNHDLINLTFFSNFDNLNLSNSVNGDKEGKCGWKNLAAGIDWRHKSLYLNLYHSTFRNNFNLEEGGRMIDLPSQISQTTLSAELPVKDFTLEADISQRHSSGRHTLSEEYSGIKNAFEGNIAASWRRNITSDVELNLGLRLSYYKCGSFSRIEPQPRFSISYQFIEGYNLFANYGRYMRFDKLVEVTTGGLPADFRTNSFADALPEDTHSLSLGVSGIIPETGVNFSIEGYYKRMLHAGEFSGSVIDFANPSYNPISDLLDGNGFSYGVSITLLKQWGRLRARLSYNLGTSRLKFHELGNSYYPSSQDRLHDLCSSITYTVLNGLNLSASFTHATGLPYTKAKYGYMIGENLICEYYPHNSSRLPSYNRLDLSANWIFLKRGRCSHSLNLSVYNALASKNILFLFSSYSLENGIRQKESAMKSVIPSVSYSLSF